MPKHITGKDIVRFNVLHNCTVLHTLLKDWKMSSLPCVIVQCEMFNYWDPSVIIYYAASVENDQILFLDQLHLLKMHCLQPSPSLPSPFSWILCQCQSSWGAGHAESRHQDNRQLPCVWSPPQTHEETLHEPQHQAAPSQTERCGQPNGKVQNVCFKHFNLPRNSGGLFLK